MKLIHSFFMLATFLLLTVYPIRSFAEEGHGAHGDEHGDEHEEKGSIHLSQEMLEKFGLEIKKVEPRILNAGLKVAGRIVPVDEKLSHVSPRFSGVVKEVKAKVGQIVQPGEILALIQNNQNLQTFSVTAAIPGMVIKRHATLGESVGENTVLFIVADLSEVYAEFAVYKQDVSKVKLGQKVLVSLATDTTPHEGEVIFFSPITEERTQSRVLRVLLLNSNLEFSPGAFVSGVVVHEQENLELAVDSTAIQQIEGNSNIFVIKNEEITPKIVQLGRSDEQVTEILSGLELNENYLSGKTFLLKAEMGKSEAEHEH